MDGLIRFKILNLPAAIWCLQLVYVALALVLLAILSAKLRGHPNRLAFQIVYVLSMFALDVAWRIAIKMVKPEWF